MLLQEWGFHEVPFYGFLPLEKGRWFLAWPKSGGFENASLGFLTQIIH